MKRNNLKFKNWRWYVCLPILVPMFLFYSTLFVTGGLLVIVGEFIQAPYRSKTPSWLKSIEKFIHYGARR